MTHEEFNERRRIIDLGDNATEDEIDSIGWTDDDAKFDVEAWIEDTK